MFCTFTNQEHFNVTQRRKKRYQELKHKGSLEIKLTQKLTTGISIKERHSKNLLKTWCESHYIQSWFRDKKTQQRYRNVIQNVT